MSVLNIVQKLSLSSSVSGPHPQHGYFCAHWVNPSPFKDTPLIHPHRHRLSIHRGRNGSTLSRARAPPPLFHLLRSLILHKLPLWQDNKPYFPSMSSLQTNYRCNTFMQSVLRDSSNSSASAAKILWQSMLFYTFSCCSHLGNIRLSESYSKHESNIFKLSSISPLIRFNYSQGKLQGGGWWGQTLPNGQERFSRLCKLWRSTSFRNVQSKLCTCVGACAYLSVLYRL